MTIQAQILEVMARLSREFGTAVIIITHNLGVVARYADRVNVMYAGKIIETATAEGALREPAPPLHPRPAASRCRASTRARTTSSIPIEGLPPDLGHLPPGCSFSPRCTFRDRQVHGGDTRR